MQWIKKNLLFVISCAVAVALIGVAGWFALSNQQQEEAVKEELNQLVQEWQRLNSSAQYPSAENIEAIKADQKRLKELRGQVVKVFPRAGAYPKMDDQAFAGYLGATIAELRAGANRAGVFLPDNYDFTFAAHRKSLKFPAGSIEQWLPQIDDIKAICNVAYQARVNVIDGIQRVPVSAMDGGTDFITASIVSNQFGVFTPYQLSFRSFTSEVAAVLDGMMRSTNCMVVKSITVVPATTALPVSSSAATATRVAQVVQRPVPQRYVAPGEEGGKGGGGRIVPGQPTAVGARTTAGALPVTIVSEQPVQVMIVLDCARLNVQ